MNGRLASAVVVVMVVLTATYMFLNRWQAYQVAEDYRMIASGKPAPELTFLLDGEVITEHRAHATGIFDGAGQHQLSFYPAAPEVFETLKENRDKIDIRVDGRLVETPLRDRGDVLQVTWDERTLSIVRHDDIRSIAANILFYRKNRQDVIQCFGGQFCGMIRITANWGDLIGPFADDDLENLRRGLPRGRWGLGPATEINIQSNVATDAWIAVSYLKISRDQEVTFGGAVQEVKPYAPDSYRKAYRGMDLVPAANLLRVTLQPGDNRVIINYSRWAQPGPRIQQKLAAYITGFKIKPANTPDQPQ